MSVFKGILGSLSINLDANVSKLETDFARAERAVKREVYKINRQIRSLERQSQQAAREVGKLTAKAVALGAVGLGVVAARFKQIADEADNIGKLATQTGLSAEAVQELAYAAEQSGGSLEAMTKAVVRLQRSTARALDGSTKYVESFERIGVSAEELSQLDMDAQFERVAQGLSELASESERNAIAMDLLGRSSQSLWALIAEGESGIQHLREQLRDTGGVLSTDAVEAAERFNSALLAIQKTIGAFQVQIFGDFIQQLAGAAEFFAYTEEGAAALQRVIDRLLAAAKAFGAYMATRWVLQLGAAIVQTVRAEIQIAKLTAQKAALARQAGITTAAVSGLGRAIGFALGPAGMAIAAISAVTSIGLAMRDAAKEAGGLDNEIRHLLMSTEQLQDSRYLDAIERQKDALEESRQAWAKAREAMERYRAPFDAAPGLEEAERGALAQEAEEARKAYAQEAATLKSLQKRFQEVRKEREANRKSADALTKTVNTSTRELDSHVKAWEEHQRILEGIQREVDGVASSLESQIDRLVEERLELTHGTRAVLEYRKAKLVAAGASAEQIAEIDRLIAKLLEEQDALARVKTEISDYTQLAQQFADYSMQMAGSILSFGAATEQATEGATRSLDSLARSMAHALTAADGASLGESIGAGLRAYGTEAISGALQDTFAEALQSLGVDIEDGQLGGYMFAAGQIIGGQLGAGIGAAIGQAVGGPIGSVIGSLVGGLFDSKPKRDRFDFGDLETLLGRKPSVDAGFFRSWFGDVAFGFTGLDDQAVAQIVHGLQEFDRALATAIQHSGAGDAVAAALANFAHLSDKEGLSIDQMMQGRFDAALKAVDGFIRELVKRGDTLEDQMQRLADVFAIETELFLGRGLGLTGAGLDASSPPPVGGTPPTRPPVDLLPPIDGFVKPLAAELVVFGEVLEGTADAAEITNAALRHTLAVVEDLQRPSESLAETFARLQEVTDALDFGIALVGTAFEGSREDLIRFGDELSRVFGDDMQSLIGGLDKIFETFFSADELAQAAADGARNIATELLERIDIDVTDDLLTLDGFRALWDDLFLALGPEQQALLIEAGGAIADLIDAEERLAGTRKDSVDALADLMADIRDQTLDALSPAHAEYNRLAQSQAAMIAQLQELGASESQLANARRLHVLQVQQLVASLEASIQSTLDRLTGATQQMSSAATSAGASMQSAADSMRNAVERIRDWLAKSLLGKDSPLLPQEQLEEAQRQFDAALAAGDLSNLPGLADQLLSQAAGFYGTSTSEYRDIWDAVRDAMEGAAATDVPDAPTHGQAGAIQRATEATAMSALEQVLAVQSVAQEVAVLSRLTSETPSEIAERLQIPLDTLAGIMSDDPVGDVNAWFDDLVGRADDEVAMLLDQQAIQESMFDSLLRVEEILDTARSEPIILPDAYVHATETISERAGETNQRLEQLAALQAQNNEQNKQQLQQQAQQIAALQDMIRMMREEQSRPREAGRIG